MVIIKQVIYGMAMMTMCIIFTLSWITIESRTNRENNAYQSLKRATDQAVTSILENQSYQIDNNEEFVAALTMMLCDSLISNDGTVQDGTTPDKNLKITIEVVQADYYRGLLSLNIIEEYSNPMGSIGTCEYATTVVFDEAKIYDTYTIRYYDANGIMIASYVVKAGDKWPTPPTTLMNQYKITRWGSVLGGGGSIFTVPSKVPLDSEQNNITKFIQYHSDTNSVDLYGNFSG